MAGLTWWIPSRCKSFPRRTVSSGRRSSNLLYSSEKILCVKSQFSAANGPVYGKTIAPRCRSHFTARTIATLIPVFRIGVQYVGINESPALTRAIEILNLIGRIGPCSAATIIAELGIPKSTVYLLLGELKKQRFISMDNQDNYCLWTKLVELAGQALSKMDLRELRGRASPG